MELEVVLTLLQDSKLLANPKRIALLRQIGVTGSISQGAKLAGLSYKAAWDAVSEMNQRSPEVLVESAVGGRGGGGAVLTRRGARFVQLYELLEQVQAQALVALEDDSIPLHSLLGVMARLSLQTSARNQFFGVVERIESAGSDERIFTALADGTVLCASITRRSRERLALFPGKDVLLLLKAPAIELITAAAPLSDFEVNRLEGRLTGLEDCDQSVELQVRLNGGDEACALVSRDQARGLLPGDTVRLRFAPEQALVAALT
ncbi:TOBE domain-containing protein [Marinobacterium sedimentorum]|uniref:TOBE domain-containing protein n=1 Tax=Marinobacterium sedimentorum TaxID=2927804 RepID=UPI0020C6FECD|nr:TOBE domain-containing protein [Marinobacterium sedimentorum]MCP8686948.1 TOBE domain-containing protein [Marinobacterium sedimentorum]